MGRGNGDLSQKLNNILFFLGGMLVVILGLILFIGVKAKAENGTRDISETGSNMVSTADPVVENVPTEQEEDSRYSEKWLEGTICYKGRYYEYNSNLKVYLLMGIDNDNPVEEATDYTKGGQSDALFLMITDAENENLSIFSINRNTMTDIEMCDDKGVDVGSAVAQICTQHGFGEGKKLSCNRTVDAVSKLFFNIPIDGYVSINMGAIPDMNDAIGGVTLEVLQDLKYPERDVNLKKGDVVTLKGNEAYCYLRGRDIHDYDSATDRLRREEQYLIAYVNTLKNQSGGNAGKATDIYNSVADYLVSSVDFEALAQSLLGYEFSEDNLYTVPGETKPGKVFEEYYPDDDEFYDMVINVFYTEVNK